MTSLLLLWALLIGASPAGVAGGDDAPGVRSPRLGLLRRMVVMGASVSDGFLLEGEIGAPANLANVLEAMCRFEHEPVQSFSNSLFYISPIRAGDDQQKAALAVEPTLVIALDFLFWYGHGLFADERLRPLALEHGLRLLEAFDCPVLVSELPDVSGAAVFRSNLPLFSLPPEVLPDQETLRRLNRRLCQWAAVHDHVHLVPVADYMNRLQSGREIRLRQYHWKAETAAQKLLLGDQLHPSLEGLTAVGLLVMEALTLDPVQLPADQVCWDLEVVQRQIRQQALRRADERRSALRAERR